jgi:hypothetical protein
VRVDGDMPGEWRAGLRSGGRNSARLVLSEERIRDLGVAPLDPYADHGFIDRADLPALRQRLEAAMGSTPWRNDYLRALIALCDACLTAKRADGVYFEGP